MDGRQTQSRVLFRLRTLFRQMDTGNGEEGLSHLRCDPSERTPQQGQLNVALYVLGGAARLHKGSRGAGVQESRHQGQDPSLRPQLQLRQHIFAEGLSAPDPEGQRRRAVCGGLCLAQLRRQRIRPRQCALQLPRQGDLFHRSLDRHLELQFRFLPHQRLPGHLPGDARPLGQGCDVMEPDA